ncbi:hypothetical protein D3C76_1537910 [compost metagenome]
MSFFCLFLFVGPAGECDSVRSPLSPDLLLLPPLLRQIGTLASTFLHLMSELNFRVDTLIEMRRARCFCQPSSKKHGLVLRLLPQTTIRRRGVNHTLFCHAFPIASRGHRYAR